MRKKRFGRRDFLRISLSGALWQVTSPFRLQASPKTSRPNIVLILADDLGWRDVGFMGSRFYETPNLDRLASKAVIFTNAYANGPNCAPTRASLLTGQYPPRHGIYTVGNPARGDARMRRLIPAPNRRELPLWEITIAEALKPGGYRSACIGKWHLGKDPESGPRSQGFDVNIGGNEKGHPKSYCSPYGNPDLTDGPEGEYLTDRLTDEAIRFVTENRDRPFFLYLSYYAVHTPLQAKPELIRKYRKKPPDGEQHHPVYAAMIENMDWNIGRLLSALDELHLKDNTIIIFLSDNGGVRRITSMAPLRGGKGMLYEGGIRVPMLIYWPGIGKPRRCSVPVMGMDLYPTILEMAGVPAPEQQTIDGLSLVRLLKGDDSLPRSAIFWHFPAYLEGNAKGARRQGFRTGPAAAIRAGSWKLIRYYEDDALELYNLEEDIGEQHNLADSFPGQARKLKELLEAWQKELDAPIPTQLNPEYQNLLTK